MTSLAAWDYLEPFPGHMSGSDKEIDLRIDYQRCGSFSRVQLFIKESLLEELIPRLYLRGEREKIRELLTIVRKEQDIEDEEDYDEFIQKIFALVEFLHETVRTLPKSHDLRFFLYCRQDTKIKKVGGAST